MERREELENSLFIPQGFCQTQTFKGRATRAYARAVRASGFSIHINNLQVPGGPQSFQELRVVSADASQRCQARSKAGTKGPLSPAPHLCPATLPHPTPGSEVAITTAAARVLSCSPLNEAPRAHSPPKTAARGALDLARLEPARLPPADDRERRAVTVSARQRLVVRLGLGLWGGPGAR